MLKQIILRTGLTLFIGLLASCSSKMMSKNECALADWYAIGYGDAGKGITNNSFNQHRKACAEHGISADFTTYMKGYDAGLFVYCTPERGYNLGKTNQLFPSHCPTDLVERVRYGYNLGKEIFLKKIQLNEEISSFEEQAKTVEEQQAALIAEKAEFEEQLQIAVDTIKDPKSEKRDIMFAYSHKEKMQEFIDKKTIIIEVLKDKKISHLNKVEELKREVLRVDAESMPDLSLPEKEVLKK